MNISILTSQGHPVFADLEIWCEQINNQGHTANLCVDLKDVIDGDLLFLVSCVQIIPSDVRLRFKACLVLHASRLPQGRGWSPHIWKILNGAKKITVSLISAEDPVDSGKIWLQKSFYLVGHELYDEINTILFQTELSLMKQAVETFDSLAPQEQADKKSTYWRRRTPEDSRVDIHQPLIEQFDLLRVVDPKRFPAFFDYRGHRYRMTIEKLPDEK